MNKLVAGYLKMGPRARAEAQFNQIQNNNKQALLAKEKAKQEEREKVARLKALRLTKELIQHDLTSGTHIIPKPNPTQPAEVLLKETSLTAHEIAEMTGLDVYQVFGIKLKSR